MARIIHYFITGTLVDVVREVNIPWDPNSDDITISTDSLMGSNEDTRVSFYNDNNMWAGSVFIRFTSPIKYKIVHCTSNIPFPVSLPTDTDMTWRIGYNPTE